MTHLWVGFRNRNKLLFLLVHDLKHEWWYEEKTIMLKLKYVVPLLEVSKITEYSYGSIIDADLPFGNVHNLAQSCSLNVKTYTKS